MTKEQVLQQIYDLQDAMTLSCLNGLEFRRDDVVGMLTKIASLVAKIPENENLVKSTINFD